MRNQSGFITVDFIFALVVVLGFTGLLFVVTFTLSIASVTQYITYSAARNYDVGNIDEATQEKMATQKYDELINNPVFKPLYSNGWFKVAAQPTIGDHAKIIPGYQAATQGVDNFWGVGTRFVAPILAFKIPFLGSTVPDGDQSGLGFQTYLGSYLGREPTMDECVRFTAARWDAIRKLPVQGAEAYSKAPADKYFPMTDDGC